MKYIYILQVAKETEVEVRIVIDSVYTTIEKAQAIGKNLVDTRDNGIIYYYVSRHLIFQ